MIICIIITVLSRDCVLCCVLLMNEDGLQLVFNIQQGEYICVFPAMCIAAVVCSQFPNVPCIRGKVARVWSSVLYQSWWMKLYFYLCVAHTLSFFNLLKLSGLLCVPSGLTYPGQFCPHSTFTWYIGVTECFFSNGSFYHIYFYHTNWNCQEVIVTLGIGIREVRFCK
jgi:hypothetical protein